MSSLTELTAQIVAARVAKKDMSTEEFQQEMQMIYSFLKGVEEGSVQPSTLASSEEPKPQLTIKQAFKKDEVICMICNKGFKTLKRHLTMAHQLKPGEYRRQFGIPSSQSLAAKSYSESRRQMALEKGLGAGLASFRASEKARKGAIQAVKVKAPAPAVKAKAPAPAVKAKTPAPAVKSKVPAPAVKVKASVPAKVAKKK